MTDLDLDGFFFVSFSWKITSEVNRLGSFLNLAASQGQNFIQCVTPYRIVLLSLSNDAQPNLGRLVVIDMASQRS